MLFLLTGQVPNATITNSTNTAGNATIQTNTPVNTNTQTIASGGNSNTSNPNQGMNTVIRETSKINY